MRRAFTLVVAALAMLPSEHLLAQGAGTVLLPDPSNPTTRVGTRGANFLEIGVGARGQAMAGAYASVAEGVTALYWNPAGIAEIEGPSAAITITKLYGDLGINHTFAGAAMPIGGGGVFGLAITSLSSGDIERTTEAFPDGGDPTFGRTFSYTATAAGLYYGRRLTDRLNIGFGVKYASEGIDNAQAHYVGVDIGTMFRTGLYGTRIAASLSNLGTSGRFQGAAIDTFMVGNNGTVPFQGGTSSLQMPTLFRFSIRSDMVGASDALLSTNKDHDLMAIAEADNAIDTDIQLTLGVQYSFRNMLFARIGKKWYNEKQTAFRSASYGLSFGGGVRLPLSGGRGFDFDYAYTNMGELNNVQVFSLELGF
ncbi:MAG TPA: PorV/PorQ family protein [Gemmatimonadales bacterium]|nr:PorV/PorQ family protein [Gemmatimonadales bacterium]